MELSVLDRMIDQACGRAQTPRRAPTKAEKEAAVDIARKVLWHIDEMYPKMWEGAPKAARTSIRNTIISEVLNSQREQAS